MRSRMCSYEVEKGNHRSFPAFHREKICKAVRMIIEALGDDPDREGLKGTPDRVARMYEEVFEGMSFSNDDIVDMFNTKFEVEQGNNDLVIVKDIEIYSYCEHHLALMYDMKVHVGYIPNGKVLGLSKIARIADMVSKRLQLQERIGYDIAYIIKKVCETEDVMVVVEGKHSCMTARGIKSGNSSTKTASIHGRFKDIPELRKEFYDLIK